MKIGIEAQRIFRPKKHGMDIVALEMIRHLQKIDKENEYYIFVKPDVDNEVLKPSTNFQVIEVPAKPYPYWEQILLPRYVKKYGIEVLHCTSNTAPLYCKVPLLLTLHDIIYLEKIDFSKGTWYQRMGNVYRKWNVPLVVNKCEKIITVSNYEKQVILNHFKGLTENSVLTVYNAVGSHFNDTLSQDFKQEIKEKYHLPDRFVFFIGNTDPKKNVENVMLALKILKAHGKMDFKLVMPDFDLQYLGKLLEKIDAIDLLDDIVLTGYVNNADLPAFYALAELFLYPSLRESFGIPMLEAMACGTPVITSNTACMPEIANDSAILVDPYQAEQIANAITEVMGNEALTQELIVAGLENAAKFNWLNTAEQVLDVYQKLQKQTLG